MRMTSDHHTCVLSSSLKKCKVNLRVEAMQWAVRTMVPDKTKFTIAAMANKLHREGQLDGHYWRIQAR